MVDEKMLQGVKGSLSRIESLKCDINLESILMEYGIDIRIMSSDEIVNAIVTYLLTDEERDYYNRYMIYKKQQDLRAISNTLNSLNELTTKVDLLYTERKEASVRISHINEIVRSIKMKMHDVPVVRISTLYGHLQNDYERYSKRAIKAGMDESRLNDRIHTLQHSSFLIRGMRAKEIELLKKELQTSKEIASSEIEERKEKYHRTREEYTDLLTRVVDDLLRQDIFLNAMLLSIKTLYGVEVQTELDYRGIDRVLPEEMKEFSKAVIIEHFFKYYEEHNGEKYDAETFRTILEDFVLYFYNLSIRRLEGQKSRCLSDISKAFSEQKELVGMIPAVNLESPTFVTQDEEDTMSLVYSMQNK